MKPNYLPLTLIILILALIILTFTIYIQDKNELTDKEVIKIIKPKVDSYCLNLQENTNSTSCPVCANQTYQYTINKNSPYITIETQIKTIYQDLWESSLKLYFKVDKKGNIIESAFPQINCSN